jgi:hypothetical protein
LQIFNIHSADHLPEGIADTYWRNEATGDWLIGFAPKHVIYENKVQDIASQTEKKDAYTLTLDDGTTTGTATTAAQLKGSGTLTKIASQFDPDAMEGVDTINVGNGTNYIIGGGKGASPMAYVMDSIRAIKEVDPNIMVEQAAGITNGQQVYDFIMAGSEAAGAASGIMNAADPLAMIDEMIAATRRAADDLKKKEG